MSYEPYIIVRKKDLESHENEIEFGEYDEIKKIKGKKAEEKIKDIEDTYDVLKRALNDKDTIKFAEIELVIFWVEYTSNNKNVRNLLDKLGIEYKLWN